MTTLFDDAAYAAMVTRVTSFSQTATRQWGRMTHAQMLEHLARALDMAVGRGPQRQVWLGRLIGWMVRKPFLGPKPFAKNGPTGPDFIVKHEPNFDAAKARVLRVLQEFQALGASGVNGNVHAFFGSMTGDEWGVIQWKHFDHHLRQFGA